MNAGIGVEENTLGSRPLGAVAGARDHRHPVAYSSVPSFPLRVLIDVSDTGDKRRRGDLDLFVLALIESAISAPYKLKTAADLSPGETIPALRRLVQDGFADQGKSGARGC